MPCCRHNSAVANPASPCFRIAMICSSLCRVPFTALLLSAQNVTLAITASVTTLVQENSHSRWSSFWGLGQGQLVIEPESASAIQSLRLHWPEYLMEVAEVGL